MANHRRRYWCVGLLVLVASACSAGGAGGGPPPPPTGGAIELAVAQSCTPGSSADCVQVNGEHVEVGAAQFSRAGVADAVAVPDAGDHDSVDLTLDPDGTAVLQDLSAQAAGAGETARLVIRVGETLVSAAAVPEPLEEPTGTVRIALPEGTSADDVVELILAG
ncbi:hypothetical protein OCAE111667_10350 [Occultella aeris]|uniref:Uncharacterized protein n=1 Tax=Occultella aeris TaxID=2761496 RepID=A0A7M4DNE0_9MICO|nr:hypothetical protein [Occultella aeris]VZO38952.1 hypothetical protein HALOF300_03670 [Occultella aeris]